MELAAQNEQNGANLKTGATTTMAGATASMPVTVSGEMRVCQKSDMHGRWQRDVCISQGRLSEDSQGQEGLRAATLPRYRLKNAPPPADPMS